MTLATQGSEAAVASVAERIKPREISPQRAALGAHNPVRDDHPLAVLPHLQQPLQRGDPDSGGAIIALGQTFVIVSGA